MESKRFQQWLAHRGIVVCVDCRSKHGKIYDRLADFNSPQPPLHPNCRCVVVWCKALLAGTATKKRALGADFWLVNFGCLPQYYITKSEAINLGWHPGADTLGKLAPGKMMTGGIYQNRNGRLPEKPGRVWREADINYYQGRRGKGRVVFSSDGLVFVSYDHYASFIAIEKDDSNLYRITR